MAAMRRAVDVAAAVPASSDIAGAVAIREGSASALRPLLTAAGRSQARLWSARHGPIPARFVNRTYGSVAEWSDHPTRIGTVRLGRTTGALKIWAGLIGILA
jgi:hypothetical protein